MDKLRKYLVQKKKLKRMFQHLNKYKNIVVTGCQRSGTTIASKMIAQDLGRQRVDELDFDVYVDHSFVNKLNDPNPKVIQAPAMFKLCCGMSREDTVIVFMERDFDDVHASEKRIDWSGEEAEMRRLGTHDGRSCELKWEYFKENKPKYYKVLPYESLSKHPLWIGKENRKHFSAKQTQ